MLNFEIKIINIMNTDVRILENQVVIMEAMLCINTVDNGIKKKLKDQIISTKALINGLV